MSVDGVHLTTPGTLSMFESPPEQRAAAVRVCAGMARDAEDLTLLLDALGLNPVEGRGPRGGSRPSTERRSGA